MTFQDLFKCVFQDFPGPFMSNIHVFPGLFNPVDIEQVKLAVDNDNVCKGKKRTRVRNAATIWFILFFHDFPGLEI